MRRLIYNCPKCFYSALGKLEISVSLDDPDLDAIVDDVRSGTPMNLDITDVADIRVTCPVCGYQMYPSDPEIGKSLNLLNSYGYPTTLSCQGHYRRNSHYQDSGTDHIGELRTRMEMFSPYVVFDLRGVNPENGWKLTDAALRLMRAWHLDVNQILGIDAPTAEYPNYCAYITTEPNPNEPNDDINQVVYSGEGLDFLESALNSIQADKEKKIVTSLTIQLNWPEIRHGDEPALAKIMTSAFVKLLEQLTDAVNSEPIPDNSGYKMNKIRL